MGVEVYKYIPLTYKLIHYAKNSLGGISSPLQPSHHIYSESRA
jgi:hypothetical protein